MSAPAGRDVLLERDGSRRVGPTTVDLHDAFLVLEDGTVTDVRPIAPRGARRARGGR